MTQQKQENQNLGINRRKFLSVGAVGSVVTAAALVFPRSSSAETLASAPATTKVVPGKCYINGFPQPERVSPRTESDPTVLTVAQHDISIIGQNPRTEMTRCYNGQVPGPTFRISAGDQLHIKLVNDLPPNDSTNTDPDKPHDFNTTNLHFHGFHVSPMSLDSQGNPVSGGEGTAVCSSDDVLYELAPRDQNDDSATQHKQNNNSATEHPYCVWLPSFHAPGTHWYHSHVHGSTAIQIVDGMAGALIIEENPGDKIDVDEDLLWIIQEVIGNDDNDVYKCVNTSQEFTVNGESMPTLKMRPGELHRWRFINATATPRGFMDLKFEEEQSDGSYQPVEKLYRIAVDGISFYGKQPEPMCSMKLSPANRADFLVQLETGKYRVCKDKFPGVRAAQTKQVLAYVEVEGTEIPSDQQKQLPNKIPGTAPPYLQPVTDEEVDNRTKNISFDASGDGCQPNSGAPISKQFEVNGKTYKPSGPHETVQNVHLNTAEEWTLTNTAGSYHPFHIHVNPFQVVEICDPNNNPKLEKIKEEDRIWWDTFYIPANGHIKIRHRFWDYPGKFVFHCHILIHEDLGMMQNVNVIGKGVGPCKSCTPTSCPKEFEYKQS